ncbi:protein-methionine-sulfoxide reductase heme-binding subunit MsrQ [Leisingera aquaemixtae]|uniref:protein-methionine-sulfoxide reductase heme-binding subunit MsrQ n=1 Tax=Leisingera aquaemixtae TaxID=1396826 RepID=UPI0021A3B0CA|nr:protein-methionine-sulfoxide reductase heme-binding subunit MsrQ [Leisingera aquaemixtae]UWQ24950.1 protein-methionine-sulfoxide reductase heme-binding subunit MsrQ [Leisingera aquaemixtae]UWQ45846.1 protein-methionine-sulfoxide reductase heme-binding subunit MsrQ [Leisingera aquaemixtae]
MAFANQLIRRLPVWAVYLLGALPAPWLFYLGLTGGLGVEPIKALEHKYGELALQLLILTLAISPLRRLLGLNLLKFRRAAGLLCFFYVLCHLLVWLVLDVQIVSQILTDIAKRPYITIGMGAFVLMLPLALTSSNLAVRKLGRAWSRLHRLTYAAAVLGAAHYVMLSKGFQIEPLIYLGLVLFLLALRLAGSRWLRQAAGVGA